MDGELDGESSVELTALSLVHSLTPPDNVGLRGPITTVSLKPDNYDTVIIVSTGTAVAPFLQLLAKAPTTVGTQFKLLHMHPLAGEDWSAPLLTPLQQKWGGKLDLKRIPPGSVRKDDMQQALAGSGRVLVLVCLPTQ